MPTTGVINGTLLRVYVNGTAIAKTTSSELSITKNTRDTSSKDSGSWTNRLYARGEWEITGDYLQAEDSTYGLDDLFALVENETIVTVKMSSEVSGDKYFTGSALITSLNRSAPDQDNVTGSFTFQSDGALSIATVV